MISPHELAACEQSIGSSLGWAERHGSDFLATAMQSLRSRVFAKSFMQWGQNDETTGSCGLYTGRRDSLIAAASGLP